MNRYLCIHGHFYQPPRENPWLEEVELQDSAYPFHDWNDRITAECYAPNTASRILDAEKRIVDIVNNYSRMSFNFGPTLLSWMAKHKPETYEAVIEADRISQERFSGHGSALAQVYNHVIMPLADSRDKRTEVVWGIRDFEYRFGREPEGMWLAETAVDLETLDVLAEHGIKFTILEPSQAQRVRKLGRREWLDASGGKIDPKRPYLCRLPSGNAITLFFYDGPVSREIAFAGLLRSGEDFAKRLLGLFSDRNEPQLVHVATDGESYGHHHRFGDMALAYALHYIESHNLAELTNYAAYLEKYPPAYEVEILENSSWSCTHGIERWRGDCGCYTGTHPEWSQEWRGPLREAMNWLRDNAARVFEREMASYIQDPWQAREDYVEVVLDRSVQKVDSFLAQHALRDLSSEEGIRVLKLLEMQRHAMLMFTSCGWFFDELSGIETLQVMRYASRVLQLVNEISGVNLESEYLKVLAMAPSNLSEFWNGAQVWDAYIRPATIDLLRVAAHYAVSSLFEEYPETATIFSYTAKSEMYDVHEAGVQKLAIGKARMRSDITREEGAIAFAVLHLGDHNLLGGVRDHMGDDSFSLMREEMEEAFQKSDITEIIRLMDKHFETHNYSLWHLFRDEQRKVLDQILDSTLRGIESSFRQVYEHHYPIMQVVKEMQVRLPRVLSTVAEFIIDMDMRELLEQEELDFERLEKLVEESKRWSFELDRRTLGFVASHKINSLFGTLAQTPEDMTLLESIDNLFRMLGGLQLELDLWQAQNIYFSVGKELEQKMEEKAEKGDVTAQKWVVHFHSLGDYLHVGNA